MLRKFAVFMVITLLMSSLAACQPAAQPTPAGLAQSSGTGITIVSTNAFVDAWASYHVTGEIRNDTGQDLISVELGIEIKDGAGNSLLKDESGGSLPFTVISPLISSLTPGETSPFTFSFDTTLGTPGSYNVTVINYETGLVNRAGLQVEHTQMVDDDAGTLFLSGELINTIPQWTMINGLAGAVLDVNNNVLSADSTATYSTLLAPAGDAAGLDRTPFIIQFANPGSGTAWPRVYWDASVAESPAQLPAVTVAFTHRYFDDYASLHIIGTLTNNGGTSLYTMAVAGLYAQDGLVLDAAYMRLPIVLDPGATIPFDFTNFSSLNYNAIQASMLDHFTVQVDPWATYPPTWSYVSLETSEDQANLGGSLLTVNGKVVNSSDRNLSGVTVIVKVLDTQGNIVATSFDYVFPAGETIVPGEAVTYGATLHLDPNADTSNYTFETIVQGDIGE